MLARLHVPERGLHLVGLENGPRLDRLDLPSLNIFDGLLQNSDTGCQRLVMEWRGTCSGLPEDLSWSLHAHVVQINAKERAIALELVHPQ